MWAFRSARGAARNAAARFVSFRAGELAPDQRQALTGGEGADIVVEVGGRDTLPRSVAAVKMGALVSIIGGVTSFAGPELGLLSVIGGMKRLHGIMVGSRAMLEDVTRLVAAQQIRPVVDRVFAFDEAPEAYAWLEAGRHFGKVVIRVA